MAQQRRHRPHLDLGAQEIVPPPDPEVASAAAAERFRVVSELPPALGGRGADAEVLRLLREAEITGIGRVVYSSNAVFIVELDAPDPYSSAEPMRAIYKPRLGERPLWDFPRDSLHLREVAAYQLDSALGFGLVPPTTLRDGPHGPGSIQLFIDNGDTQPEAEAAELRLREVATLDAVANNADRKRAHLLLGPEAGIWCIDNALTFLPYPRQRTVLLDLGGSEIPARPRAALRGLVESSDRMSALAEDLGRLLDLTEVAATLARLEELHLDPTYPLLDPWDSRPWEGW